MTDEALRIDRIQLRKAPGFKTDQLTVDAFAPDINIIHGPNGVGKSTLARSLLGSLWPTREPEFEIGTWFSIGDEEWMVETTRGSATYQLKGRSADPPSLPASEYADRYELALDKLMEQGPAASQTFAETIEQQTLGGYDLDAAYEALDFHNSPHTTGLKAYDEAERAREQLQKKQREEAETLTESRRRLPQLEEELQAAAEARERVEVLKLALEYDNAQEKLSDARTKLETYPQQLDTLDGKEADRAAEFAERINKRTEKIEEAEEKLDDAEADLKAAALEDDGVSNATISALRDRREKLSEAENKRDQLRGELQERKDRRDEARDRIPFDIDAETLAAIEPNEWSSVQDFLEDVEEHTASKKLRTEVDDWLAAESDTDVDVEIIDRGQQELKKWLSSPSQLDDSAPNRSRVIDAAAVLLLLVGIVGLVQTANLLFALVAVIGVGIGAFLYFARQRAQSEIQVDQRQASREAFESLDLDPIENWDEQTVKTRLRQLYREEEVAIIDEVREKKRRSFAASDEDLEEQQTRLEQTREQLRKAHGIHVEVSSDLQLADLADTIRQWKDAHAAVVKKNGKLKSTIELVEERREKLVEELATYGYDDDGIEDSIAVTECIDDLKDRKQCYVTATSAKNEATSTLESERAEIDELTAKHEAIFTAVDLEPDARTKLESLCEQVQEYEKAKRAVDQAANHVKSKRKELEAHPAFRPKLREQSRDELTAAKEDAAETAATYDERTSDIAKIEQRIEQAKGQTSVAEAEEAQREAFAQLKEYFESDVDAMVGHVLVDHLREQTEAEEKPAVFKHARRLLKLITAHRYRLDFDDGEFFVFDTARGRGLSLDELSKGTQIQLLLAVRLAFVERRERGTKLPVVLDETLATSDDRRAEVLIDSLIELAKEGRQVFYFTAQSDEVAKWNQALEEVDDLDHKLIDLATQVEHSDSLNIPEESLPTCVRPTLPGPEGHDHASYGEALEVQRFSPRANAETAHIWYVVEEPELLYELLMDGLETWGQLRELLRGADEVSITSDTTLLKEIRHNGRALETLVEYWNMGRGKRVDHAALEATSAVTDTYLEDVSQLAKDNHGDAEEIIMALENGEVPRFWERKIRELEQYFREQGYLTEAEIVPDERIRARMRSALKEQGLTGEEAQERVDALLRRVQPTIDEPLVSGEMSAQ